MHNSIFILHRWIAGLTIFTSKVMRMMYPTAGLAPSAEISPCAELLLLLSPSALTAFKSFTVLLPVFVSS